MPRYPTPKHPTNIEAGIDRNKQENDKGEIVCSTPEGEEGGNRSPDFCVQFPKF